MTATALWQWSAVELANAISRQEISCEAVMQSLLERVTQTDQDIQAWAHLDREQALANARHCDQTVSQGFLHLHGVPFAAKDIINSSTMPTAFGSPIYADHQPSSDAACIALCQRAGALLLGKTVTTEFGHVYPGKTRNPHNPQHTPGGSSSGSAAAVAAGMVPVALGTQTTGSIIRPAAYCGVIGYKPSFGDFIGHGVHSNAPSFDTLGLMARCVDDLALFRAALMAETYEPLPDASVRSLRIGLYRTPFWQQADYATQQRLETIAQQLSKAGATVTEFQAPPGFTELKDSHRLVSGYEFARVMAFELTHHSDQLSRALREGRVNDGLNCSYNDYRHALASLTNYRRTFTAAVTSATVDLLLTPSAPSEAPAGLEATGDPLFNGVWTALHLPALTLPAGQGPQGLPLGVQLIGPFGADRSLLTAAKAINVRMHEL